MDDASTDDTPRLCEHWQRQYPQLVRVIRMGDNVGPGVARNRGIAAACGDFIAFVDVDDQLLPAFLARLMDRIVGSRADVALCGMNIVKGNRCRQAIPPVELTATHLLQESVLLYSASNKIYKTNFLKQHQLRFPASRLGEDMAFSIKLCTVSPIVVSVPEAMYIYDRRSGSLTGGIDVRREIFTSLIDIRNFMQRNECYRQFSSLYCRLCLMHGLYYPTRLLITAALRQVVPLSRIVHEFLFYLSSTAKAMGKNHD